MKPSVAPPGEDYSQKTFYHVTYRFLHNRRLYKVTHNNFGKIWLRGFKVCKEDFSFVKDLIEAGYAKPQISQAGKELPYRAHDRKDLFSIVFDSRNTFDADAAKETLGDYEKRFGRVKS